MSTRMRTCFDWSAAFAALACAWMLAVTPVTSQAGGTAPLPADSAVRAGMDAIRATVVDHHTLITHRRLPVAAARTMQAEIQSAIRSIRTAQASDPARAALEPLLTAIESNAASIGQGGDSIRQMDALFAITKTLDTYGGTFDHPGWTPIQAR